MYTILFSKFISSTLKRLSSASLGIVLTILTIPVLHQTIAAQVNKSVKINSVGGWTAGDLVVNAKWMGQPDRAPSRGRYYGVYAIDSDSGVGCSWTIKGSGFGNKTGSITFTDSNITHTIKSWKDAEIVIVPKVPYTFTQNPSVTMTIMTSDGPRKGTFTIPVIGTIKTRGYGQCTWYVAYRRLAQAKSIPSPGAYASTGAINGTYEPRQWDVLHSGTAHTMIIISAPVRSEVLNRDGTKTITYTFTIGEMNASPAWCECTSSTTSGFVVTVDRVGNKSVKTGIKSGFSKTAVATNYWR